ncbi:MAG: hypothetical protein R3E92_00705 [Burkholderiaceae bacterium]|nr:hypothetical protein [Rhodoferax sp.]MCB2030518.1 hypothetical protein [Rhodoferax sp.]MCB2040339.1 hypothetical protein [Rhodoferax sp.]MCP5260231.1 hypothetical protein [Rhodoferax sp.]
MAELGPSIRLRRMPSGDATGGAQRARCITPVHQRTGEQNLQGHIPGLILVAGRLQAGTHGPDRGVAVASGKRQFGGPHEPVGMALAKVDRIHQRAVRGPLLVDSIEFAQRDQPTDLGAPMQGQVMHQSESLGHGRYRLAAPGGLPVQAELGQHNALIAQRHTTPHHLPGTRECRVRLAQQLHAIGDVIAAETLHLQRMAQAAEVTRSACQHDCLFRRCLRVGRLPQPVVGKGREPETAALTDLITQLLEPLPCIACAGQRTRVLPGAQLRLAQPQQAMRDQRDVTRRVCAAQCLLCHRYGIVDPSTAHQHQRLTVARPRDHDRIRMRVSQYAHRRSVVRRFGKASVGNQ